jgi:hypothetical protein
MKWFFILPVWFALGVFFLSMFLYNKNSDDGLEFRGRDD